MEQILTLAQKAMMKPKTLRRYRLNRAFRIATYYFCDKGIFSGRRPPKKKVVFKLLAKQENIPNGIKLDDFILELYISKKSIFGQKGVRKINRATQKKHSYKKYLKYINSAEWRRKREDAFVFHGKMCGHCGSTKQLEVHHTTYKNLFNEPMGDLMVLCHLCHKKVHQFKKAA